MPRPRKLPPGMWRRGDTYYARFRAHGGLVRKKLSTNFEVAKTLLNELRARADRADFGLSDNDYPWQELKAEFLRWAKQAVRDAGDYKADLGMFEKYCEVRSVRQIDAEYVHGFREWRLSGGGCTKRKPTVTPRTINRQVGTLKNMLNKGVEWDRIGENSISDIAPLRHDKPAKERRSLSIEEVLLIFKEASDSLRPLLRMFITSGLRRGELVNMKFADVDFERRVVTVRASTAKNHRSREIPLDGEMATKIQRLQAEAKQRQPIKGKTPKGRLSREHVFVTGANTPWKNNLLRAFYALCKRIGIEGAEPGGSVDLHALRVSFTTLAMEGGASPKAIQSILGHSTLALTMTVYAKATENAKRDAIDALPFASAGEADVIQFPGKKKAK